MAKKILIVDDDADFVEATKNVLKSSGYDVEWAQNGKEAFERIMSEPDVQVPEVPKATSQSNLENVLVFP